MVPAPNDLVARRIIYLKNRLRPLPLYLSRLHFFLSPGGITAERLKISIFKFPILAPVFHDHRTHFFPVFILKIHHKGVLKTDKLILGRKNLNMLSTPRKVGLGWLVSFREAHRLNKIKTDPVTPCQGQNCPTIPLDFRSHLCLEPFPVIRKLLIKHNVLASTRPTARLHFLNLRERPSKDMAANNLFLLLFNLFSVRK